LTKNYVGGALFVFREKASFASTRSIVRTGSTLSTARPLNVRCAFILCTFSRRGKAEVNFFLPVRLDEKVATNAF